MAELGRAGVSRTLEEPLAWENARLAGGEAVDVARSLKAEGAVPLRTIRSSSLCRSLPVVVSWTKVCRAAGGAVNMLILALVAGPLAVTHRSPG